MVSRNAAVAAFLAVMLLAGCATAPQLPVALAGSSASAGAGKIGIAMAPLPQPGTQYPGASCLLCLAAASMMNTSLSTHSKTLPLEDLPQLKERVADLLRGKGAEVQVIPDALVIHDLPKSGGQGTNLAARDFRGLQKKYGIDRLVVISIDTLGFERSYAAYVPTGDPKAVLQGTGYMVNLASNTYDWYQPLMLSRSADGAWDEPHKFPGLTNAYFQVLEMGKDEVLKPFKP